MIYGLLISFFPNLILKYFVCQSCFVHILWYGGQDIYNDMLNKLYILYMLNKMYILCFEWVNFGDIFLVFYIKLICFM